MTDKTGVPGDKPAEFTHDVTLKMIAKLAIELNSRGCAPEDIADAMVIGAVNVAIEARGASYVAGELRKMSEQIERNAKKIDTAMSAIGRAVERPN